ncbi:MAG: hypothetical protein IPF70_20605 [Saprospiraceae bacterium]|nr:hypothetical protein [Saprospiraceae bacterium]MBK9679139.1 hypothetical protein [Saprospiraceae bacterium]
MKKKITFILILGWLSCCVAQIDPLLLKQNETDTSRPLLNMDAVYNRPFVTDDKLPVALGGYVETNWQHLGTDGISEGHQFQFRRMSLFISSTIQQRLKFLSEIEFEDGGKKIAVEYAAVDFEINPLLNLRGGMILNPIGSFNQNHDGPKWEFNDRPIPSTQLLPSTWSNAGFGIYGKKYKEDWMLGYEAYFSGNFDHSIIDNKENKSFLPAAKANPERFEELNSGLPLFTGKVAVRNKKIGELGLSYMGGAYNKYQDDGIILDEKRRVDVFALDFNTTITSTKTSVTTEWAFIKIQVPESYTQQYGQKQIGGFVDLVQPIISKKMFGWDQASFNVACRLEYVDWNIGRFKETDGKIGDELWSIMPSISFRPSTQSVLRLNYRYLKQKDLLGNPPALTAGFNFGISSYF